MVQSGTRRGADAPAPRGPSGTDADPDPATGATTDPAARADGRTDDVAPGTRVRGGHRLWRLVVLVVLVVLFMGGSLIGNDDWWPFGPWRMFATSTAPTGAISVMAIEVRTPTSTDWIRTGMTPENMGLNRAEIEGQVPQTIADPSRLGTLAAAHARLHPGDAPWTSVRLVKVSTEIKNGQRTGRTFSRTLAVWHAERTHG